MALDFDINIQDHLACDFDFLCLMLLSLSLMSIAGVETVFSWFDKGSVRCILSISVLWKSVLGDGHQLPFECLVEIRASHLGLKSVLWNFFFFFAFLSTKAYLVYCTGHRS